jgi:hypothetical protein
VPLPFPPHVAAIHESRRSTRRQQGRDGALGIVQGERRSPGSSITPTAERPSGPVRLRAVPEAPARRARRPGKGEPQEGRVLAGCLASLSAAELDLQQALAPKLGLELVELQSVTCCGAGDIHEAEPDYYLHLNARILSYAEATGCDTLMTVCNVCTLTCGRPTGSSDDTELRPGSTRTSSVGRPP